MFVECDNCGTGYNLDEANIPADGAWVRCTNCGEVFQVMPPAAQPEPAAPTRPADELGLGPGGGGEEPAGGSGELGGDYSGDLLGGDGLDDFGLDAEFEDKGKSGCMGRMFKAVFWLLALIIILVILAAGGLFAMGKLGMGGEYLNQVRSLNLPYVNQMLDAMNISSGGGGGGGGTAAGPASDEPVQMEVIDPKGLWRNNKVSGRIFIVQGSVKNNHQTVRTHVLVHGTLSDSKDQVVAKATVYAGPRFTPEELTTLPLEEIQNRLKNPKAPDGSLYVVPPGERLFFMVVIGNLPDDLALYTVEVVGSKPFKTGK
jgi:predicted Zn finger-like uncharacterized protein